MAVVRVCPEVERAHHTSQSGPHCQWVYESTSFCFAFELRVIASMMSSRGEPRRANVVPDEAGVVNTSLQSTRPELVAARLRVVAFRVVELRNDPVAQCRALAIDELRLLPEGSGMRLNE